MRIIVANSSPDPIYEQIAKQIKVQIISGSLKEGESLPSIRGLAKELSISVITTKRAYEDLEREGFIDTVAGKGSFVAVQNQEFLREKRMRIVEEKLLEAISEAQLLGLSREELLEMLEILFDVESIGKNRPNAEAQASTKTVSNKED